MDPIAALLIGALVGYTVRPDGHLAPVDYGKLAADIAGQEKTFAKIVPLDLATPRSSQQYHESGTAVVVVNPDVASVPVTLRFSPDGEAYDLSTTRSIRQPFSSFYITNAAGTGTLQLLISKSPLALLEPNWIQRVNIIAQQADLDVNLAAQSANVDINIKAQTLGISLMGDWAAQNATDKNFVATVTNGGFGSTGSATYTVAAGKTLYICGLSCQGRAYAAADSNNNQIVLAKILDNTAAVDLVAIGGNGGGAVALPKPVSIPAAHQFYLALGVYGNHAMNAEASAWGYEL